MTLGEFENLILTTLQQPGADYANGAPDWQNLNLPQYSQGLVDFCINEGYRQAMAALWEFQLTIVSFTITSTVRTNSYPIPPTGYSPISHVVRVFYQANGLPYNWEFRPGTGFISWDEFQQTWTGQGYLDPYSYATQPYVCTIDPLLKNVFFYPGSQNAGDTITIDYIPNVSDNSSDIGAPALGASTTTPLLPIDTHMAIFYFAMHLLWARARESQESQRYLALYEKAINDAKVKYGRKFNGDNVRIVPQVDYLGLTPF